MIRLFFQLYLLIVTTLIGVGWGLEKLWQLYGDNKSAEETSLNNTLLVLEHRLVNLSPERWSGYVEELSHTTPLEILVFEFKELSGDSVTDKLREGEIAHMQGEHNQWIVLKKVGATEKVIGLKQYQPTDVSTLEWILRLVFYAAIALVIMIWVWPLSRDLKVLEEATRRFGDHNWQFDLGIKPGAQIYPLASAFQKMAQRIEGLINSHKDMSNAVSHEIKTPLARMKFELAMAENANSLERLQGNMANIKEDIAEMDALASATLDYAVLERADFALNLTPHNFTEVIRSIIDHMDYTGRQQNRPELQFALCAPDDVDNVVCDGHLMERVVKNLLYNAAKYAKKQIRVTFAVNGDIYRLSVEDDGPGVPQQDWERIFNSFVRVEQSKQAHDGFGLGLAIVKRIVEWHGGKVSASGSTLGGARFIVSWPRNNRASVI